MLKVGVFDSGLGGLTVVKALTKVIKGAHLFYIADTLHAPYGEKSSAQILQYSLDITQYFLDEHKIDALIIACNTATSAAIKQLRKKYPNLIIIGTEPGIKPALEKTLSGKVGVLATPATLQGDKYLELATALSHGKDITLYEQACPGLVEQIETGALKTSKTQKMLENWLKPMRDNGVDTIVLGCTHYPLIADEISAIMQNEVTLIETGSAIANRLLELSMDNGHKNEGDLRVNLYTTSNIKQDLVKMVLPQVNPPQHISL